MNSINEHAIVVCSEIKFTEWAYVVVICTYRIRRLISLTLYGLTFLG